jgi:acetyl-CoA acetyltransferase
MLRDPIVIVAAVRTPMGGFQGALAGASAPQLGAVAIAGAQDIGKTEDGGAGRQRGHLQELTPGSFAGG